jgi:hypothetical protein
MVIHNVVLMTDSSRTGDNFGNYILDFSVSEKVTYQTYIGLLHVAHGTAGK